MSTIEERLETLGDLESIARDVWLDSSNAGVYGQKRDEARDAIAADWNAALAALKESYQLFAGLIEACEQYYTGDNDSLNDFINQSPTTLMDDGLLARIQAAIAAMEGTDEHD